MPALNILSFLSRLLKTINLAFLTNNIPLYPLINLQTLLAPKCTANAKLWFLNGNAQTMASFTVYLLADMDKLKYDRLTIQNAAVEI